MDIKFIKAYKSIQEGFEWKDVPNFAIITGINGAGKTQLLDAIKKNDEEIVSITDDKGVVEEIVVRDEKAANEQSIEGLIEYKNNYAARQATIKDMKRAVENNTDSLIRATERLKLESDEIEKQRIQNSIGAINKNIANFKKTINQSTIYAYEKELEEISDKVKKEPKDLANEEVRANANPYFNTLTDIKDFESYVKQEYEERKERLVQLSKKRDYDKFREESETEYSYQIINRYFHKFGVDYFEMQDPFGEGSQHKGKIWFKGKMEEEVEYNDLSSGEQMIVKYIFWTFGKDFRGNRINTMLLDEPDNHLHPSMCKMMVNLLYELSKPRSEGGSGIRIIITTHSPSTVAFAPEGNLFVMGKNNDNERSIRLVSTEEAEDVLSEGIFTYRKAINTFNIALASQCQNLLFVEGKTDAVHIKKAIDVLGMDIDVEIIPIHNADSLRDFIRSTPTALFGGRKMMALWDSDDEGEKAYSKISGEGTQIKGVKRITAEQCNGLSYVFKIQPSDVSLSKHCPIEFLYPLDYLKRNEIVEKLDYGDFKNVYREEEKSRSDTDRLIEEFDNDLTLRPYKVIDGAKVHFANIIRDETDPAIFEGFRPTLELIRQIIEL